MKGTDYKRLERLLFQLFSDHFAVCFFFYFLALQDKHNIRTMSIDIKINLHSPRARFSICF
jgi:hypothetical protein